VPNLRGPDTHRVFRTRVSRLVPRLHANLRRTCARLAPDLRRRARRTPKGSFSAPGHSGKTHENRDEGVYERRQVLRKTIQVAIEDGTTSPEGGAPHSSVDNPVRETCFCFSPKNVSDTSDLRLIKARVLIKLPPGGPEEGGERYQQFEEIVGALPAQIFRSESMRMVFLMIFEIFASGTSKSG
jgi:hypothetical protein